MADVPLSDPQIDADGLRRVSDPTTLRALAHPVRIAILEVLGMEGPLTATEVSERIGESATTCSFHLRQLAKYGFVEEAGGGKGRARPWRRSATGLRLNTLGDPQAEVAAVGVRRILRDRHLDRYRLWTETSASYPAEWRAASQESETIAHLTVEELSELNDRLRDLLLTYRDRTLDASKRPEGSRPVEFLLFSYPIQGPADEAADPSPRRTPK